MSQKIVTQKSSLLLVGITARTNNFAETNPETAQIGKTLHTYINNQIAYTIPNRKNPGITYCVYTEYESDYTGSYTYFVGEEVTCFANKIPEGLSCLTIPDQKYSVFTTNPGPMPDVCIQKWIQIWNMTEDDLGEKRSYIADFELYDDRASDPANTILDIFIGLKN